MDDRLTNETVQIESMILWLIVKNNDQLHLHASLTEPCALRTLFARQHNAKSTNREEYLLFAVPEQIRWLNSNDFEFIIIPR